MQSARRESPDLSVELLETLVESVRRTGLLPTAGALGNKPMLSV